MPKGKRHSWSTQIYRALTWSRFRIMLQNEADAVDAIEDLYDRSIDDMVISLGSYWGEEKPRNSRAAGLSFAAKRMSPILRNFVMTSRDVIATEAMDSERQTRAATRAAIMGTSLRPAVRDAEENPKKHPDPSRPDLEGIWQYQDEVELTYAEMINEPFLNTTLQAWGDKLADLPLSDMAKAYTLGVTEGMSMEQVAAMIAKEFDLAKGSARKMARTAVQAAANRMQEKVYKANEDLMKGVTFTATLDFRTCEICGGYDGTTYSLNGSRPSVPVHVQCRCNYVPVMKSAKELGLGPLDIPDDGQRESMDGLTPGTMTWDEWIKQKDVQSALEKWKKKEYEKQKKRAKRKAAQLQKVAS